ncbi:zwei Ig domain protein zig-8 [Penaeus vannamei]|uniref:zwei Ig domain protein zig-8 n=1 Tax=Penaeus vannamei TaxID=6689 RepID=UPI000F673835|nr:zwei Ig domain protein zig-8-like [Penaeus vannamei]
MFTIDGALLLLLLLHSVSNGDASRSRSQNENFRRMVPTPAVFNNGFQETHRLAATHASFRFPASHQFRKMAKNHDARKYLAALSPSGSRANASTFSSHEDFRARGSYFLNARGSGEEVFPAHYEQRTWTAAPRLDLLDPDTTTRDPAIPENPEGLKNPSLLVGLWEEEPTIRETDAYFKGENGSAVEAQAGTTANIPCVILNRADHETVSWTRLRDHHLITVGRQTYSKDDRFSVTYNRHLNEWTLHLRYAQERDAGEYMCQLSTHPPMVFIANLTITQASAEILGRNERFVHEGSAVVLTCILKHHTQPPEYVFWYHNRTMINFETNRQVRVEKTRDGSILTLTSVGRTDSGNYTCSPDHAKSASITLHIILGDAPAAMQVSGSSCTFPSSLLQSTCLLLGLHRLGICIVGCRRWLFS